MLAIIMSKSCFTFVVRRGLHAICFGCTTSYVISISVSFVKNANMASWPDSDASNVKDANRAAARVIKVGEDKTVTLAAGDSRPTTELDRVQIKYQCCGKDNFTDWIR